MSGATVFAVKVLGVPGEELSHDGRDAVLSALEENMDMVIHKNPGVNSAFAFVDVLAKPIEEPGLIFVVPEDI
jgi:hypothetical protein